MRFAWIAFTVILIDGLSKLLLLGPWSDDVRRLASGIGLELTRISTATFTNYLRGESASETWLLLGGLLVIFFMLFRVGSGFLNAAPLTGIGVQLATGGIFAQVLDQFFQGRIIRPFSLPAFDGLTIAASIGDVAIVGGLLFLLYGFVQRQFTPRVSALGLKRGHDQQIDLSGFPRGIDNVHVDVALSPAFTRAAAAVIADLAPRYRKETRRDRNLLTRAGYRALAETYVPMVQAALVRAKNARQPSQLNLLYIGVIKFLQQQIHTAVDRALSQTGRAGSITLRAEVVTASVREYQQIHYRIGRSVFGALAQIETERLSELRRSLLGSSRFLLVEALNAPILRAASPLDDELMLRHYLLLAHVDNEPNSFPRIDSVLTPVFARNLAALPPTADENETVEDDGSDNLAAISISSEYQRALNQPSVLMRQTNITAMLDTRWAQDRMVEARTEGRKDRLRRLRRQLRHQRYMLALLRNALEQNGLLRQVIAAYEVPKLTDGTQYNATILLKTLTHPGGVPAIRKRLASTPDLPPFKTLLKSYLKIKRKARGDVSDLLLRFMRDFAAYRLDLQLFYYVQQAAAQVRLVSEEKDILTSRSNHSLHEFLAPSEVAHQKAEIVSHAILKADLRGSTRITEELTRKKLNPATHFSRHFFDPVNQVLSRYGAEKVFIEGDAIILIFNEYDTEHSECLAVSRASGMAADMLKIVARQNKLLAGHGLPQLELGIGIAYNANPPRFLYDGETRITISPAINRADRLSACAWAIKEWFGDTVLSTTHVAVYEPSPAALKLVQKAEKDLVYNLNGIVLEPAAFKKLRQEVNFQPVDNPVIEYPGSRLYAGSFPDQEGNIHSLVVREAPVQLYEPEYLHGEAPEVEGRHYYEVVYDPGVLRQLAPSTASASHAVG